GIAASMGTGKRLVDAHARCPGWVCVHQVHRWKNHSTRNSPRCRKSRGTLLQGKGCRESRPLLYTGEVPQASQGRENRSGASDTGKESDRPAGRTESQTVILYRERIVIQSIGAAAWMVSGFPK